MNSVNLRVWGRAVAASRAAVVLTLASAASTFCLPSHAGAVPISPRVLAGARGTPLEAVARQNAARYEQSRSLGVDRVFPNFALDLAKYPRGGVAHRNVMVVLMNFDADAFGGAVHASAQSTAAYYHRLFFSDDPNDGVLSMREYYRIQSHGRLVISGRVTPGWLTMPHSYAYYVNGQSGLAFGAYPRSAQKLAEDAMSAAYDAFDQNLGFFDNDGPDGIPSSGDDDGYIDAALLIHPGQGAEVAPISQENDVLWSHQAGVSLYQDCPLPSSPNCLPGIILGNVRGFIYTMNGEFNYGPLDYATGTYFHEFGHTLGLADLYEWSSCGNLIGSGLGIWSLMSLGNYLPVDPPTAQGSNPGSLDAWSRQFLGFEQPTVVTQSGTYTLEPLTKGGGVLKVWSNGMPGTEYFLIENRFQSGSDRDLPAGGLVIYHIDDTLIDNCRDCDNVSCFDPPAPHYRVGIVQADGQGQLESPTGTYGDAGDPFPGSTNKTSWTEATTPNTRSYAGTDTGIRLTNLVVNASGTATFNLTVATTPKFVVTAVGVLYDIDESGSLDPGESDSLQVFLQNVGTPSGPLNLTLSTADPDVTVTQASSTAPASSAGDTIMNTPLFGVSVSPSISSLPHAVLFNLAWNNGTNSGTVPFTMAVGSASINTSFESGLGAWTTSAVAPTAIDEWHLSTTRAHTGPTSVKLGSTVDPSSGASNESKTYANLEDAVLVSPMFGLLPGSQLSFSSWIDAETHGGTQAFDGARVEISLMGGEWRPLQVDGGYGYQIDFDSASSLRGQDVFSGTSHQWRHVVADLTGYSGPAQIRFRFASNEQNFPQRFPSGSLARYYEGWYVDDVSVGPRVDPGPTPRVLSLRGGPNPFKALHGFTSAMTFRFSAPDGLPHPGLVPQVKIFDLTGRLVRTLDAAPDGLIPSEFRASWNARNEKGKLASSGIYFAKVDILGHTESFSIVLFR